MRTFSLILILTMTWLPFLRAKSSPIEKRHEAKVEYLGEKTGPTEDDLKKSLKPVLEKYSDVERAYLAIVSTDGRKSWSVALCLAPEKEDQKVVQEVGEVFHRMFGKGQFLDMLFLSSDAESEIQKVCPAFYAKKKV
jgi:hypothetical protein